MLDLEDAQRRILERVGRVEAGELSIDKAPGSILAADIKAPRSLPAFDNSAMDGYAVRAADLAPASKDHPITLTLAGLVAAGQPASVEITTGKCVRIFTGSILPRGADAVVMQEDVLPGRGPEEIQFTEAVRPWENIRFSGEDVKAGDPVGAAGQRISASQSGLFAALGIATVPVAARPRVGLIATGSELREPGEPLREGEIYESNRITLGSLIEEVNGLPIIYPIVKDTLSETRAAIDAALAECDLLITTGGASVGELDYVKAAFLDSGGTVDFWRVAIKPGKPFMFGRSKGKALFGLPGNPVSAFVTFLLLARPAILKMQGALQTGLDSRKGRLAERLVNDGNRRHFMRVCLDSRGSVALAGGQASHQVGSLARANGLVDVAPDTVLEAGTEVDVLCWAL